LLVALCGIRESILKIGQEQNTDLVQLADGVLDLAGADTLSMDRDTEASHPDRLCSTVMQDTELVRGEVWPRRGVHLEHQ